MTTATATPTRCDSCGAAARINVTMPGYDSCLHCEKTIVAVDIQDVETAAGVIGHLIDEGRIAPADVVEIGRASSGDARTRAELHGLLDKIRAERERVG